MARQLARMLTSGAAIAALSLGTAGCAGVRVYSDPALKNETGVRVFTPKPYLLVSRTGAKDKPLELSIVYLPDTKDVLYITQRGGWGSNDLSLKISNGMLTDFGTKSDSRIPESLGAISSLLTAAAGAYRGVQDSSPRTPEPGGFELYEIKQENGRTRLVRVEIAAGGG